MTSPGPPSPAAPPAPHRAAQALARLGRSHLVRSRLAEALVVYSLALVAGQVVFLGQFGPTLWPLAQAYWMFLFVAWAGMRLGLAGTAILLGLVAVQAGWGMWLRVGFFAHDLRYAGGLGYLSFIAILSLVGMALAYYLERLRRQLTSRHRRAQARRRRREQAQRQLLVSELHHRIKNNLQGISGVLQALGQRHPELAEPMTEVTGQVQSIALLYGLQGHSHDSPLPLCELTREVATGVGALWGVTVRLQLPSPLPPCQLHPREAMPVALILHELILNAIKHGGRAQQDVMVTAQVASNSAAAPQEICLSISNPGHWPAPGQPRQQQTGLELVAALMPRSGATLVRSQQGDRAVARLCLRPPVLQAIPTPQEPYAFVKHPSGG